MKRLLVLILSLFVAACGCDRKSAETAREQLMHRLSSSAEDGRILYGHQDDLVYGHSWVVSDVDGDALARSDIRDVAGRYPAVVGFDLGGIEMGDRCNLDSVPFDLIRKAALTHISRGGVVTFSWHPRNPLTGGDAWDISSDEVVYEILPDGGLHDRFMVWLDHLAGFLESLDGAPVIFRPWHENLGSWFWWGWSLCSATEYKALYQLTHDYLVQERGLTNLIWCYSPNGPVSEADYLSRYPGDAYVDMMGTDIYEYVGEDGMEAAGARFQAQVREMLSTLRRLAPEHGKLWCLSETGLEGLVDPHWWTEVQYPAITDSGICYVLTWRNAHDRPGHFYAPWNGFDGEGDFKVFSEKDDILFL